MENTINKCQCSACGKFFVGTSVFDKHRVGPYTKGDRRCLTDEEMQSHGLDYEKKLVKFYCGRKEPSYEEHNVWFLITDRERMRQAFSPLARDEEEVE